MKPQIIVVYHCAFFIGDPPAFKDNGAAIVKEQMAAMQSGGLLDACSEFIVGINGSEESHEVARLLIPAKARIVWHGLQSRSENLTLVEIEKLVKTIPENTYIQYSHCKGISHDPNSDYGKFAARWRRCMQKHCVENWRAAVAALDRGCEAAGVHWLTEQGHDKSQHFFAGNFWWATSDFLATLPSIYERERIKISGIDSLESRFEAEVWIGNGPRLPKMKDLELSHGLGGCP